MCAAYKTITPIQIANGVCAYQDATISFKALRVYFACFELQAIREAAKRSQRKKGASNSSWVSYQRKELIAATGGLTMRSIGKSLSELRKAGILDFKERGLVFTEIPTSSGRSLLEATANGRKSSRPIPVPRRLLRYLSSLNKPALFLTLVAYVLRGLSINRKSGEIKTAGSVKASFISEVFGISLRAVKGARAEMIALGLISRDTGSYQRKLNRDGAYFRINFEWCVNGSRGESSPKAVDNFFSPKTEFAPPRVENSTETAPPKERLKTSKEIKNQKTRRTEPTGVCKQTLKEEKPPTIWDVQPEDLRVFSRNEELYWEAKGKGLISGSEADILNWIAASIRARETENPARIFMGIIKKKLFHHITQAQEDQARKALLRRRETHPEAFREPASERLAA